MKNVKNYGLLIGFLVLPISAELMAAFEEGQACVLEPSMEVKLSASVPGVLSNVYVQRGDNVKRGQRLATLDSGSERAAVELARARVEFGKRKAVRNEDLYKKELVSIHEKDEMDTEVEISQLQLKQAEEKLKLRSIRSPINGVVIEREKDPGEYVEVEPLLTIVSLDPLHVEVVVPAEHFGSIKQGMQGEVQIGSPINEVYTAKVILIDRVIDAASGTIRVRLLLNNPDNAIPAGIKCQVRFVE